VAWIEGRGTGCYLEPLAEITHARGQMNHAEHAPAERMPSRYDVIVIGAGQAGLAMGYFLARQGRRFVILDGADRSAPPGASAGTRWSSSRLAASTASPGLPSPAIPTAIRRATR
jgi:NADPH-dependent 2,4-dienoyl-CoA reductase/sulfur reductase-like enzyme